MDNTTNTTPVTLESIAQKKAMLLQEIRLQKEIMTGLTQETFCSAGTSYQQGKCHDESIQHRYGCF